MRVIHAHTLHGTVIFISFSTSTVFFQLKATTVTFVLIRVIFVTAAALASLLSLSDLAALEPRVYSVWDCRRRCPALRQGHRSQVSAVAGACFTSRSLDSFQLKFQNWLPVFCICILGR